MFPPLLGLEVTMLIPYILHGFERAPRPIEEQVHPSFGKAWPGPLEHKRRIASSSKNTDFAVIYNTLALARSPNEIGYGM